MQLTLTQLLVAVGCTRYNQVCGHGWRAAGDAIITLAVSATTGGRVGSPRCVSGNRGGSVSHSGTNCPRSVESIYTRVRTRVRTEQTEASELGLFKTQPPHTDGIET